MPRNDSFLPEDYLQKKIATRTNAICITLFALVMAGVVAAFLVTDRQRGEVRELQAKVNEQFREAALRIEQLEQLQADKKLMKQRAKVAEVLIERLPRSVILAELTNRMPATLSLTDFEMKTEVLRIAPRPKTSLQREAEKNQKKRKSLEDKNAVEIKPTELQLTLVGVAPTDLEVSQFMTSLNQHELFKNINLAYSEDTKVEEQSMRKFELEMVLNQNASLKRLDAGEDLAMDPMGDTIEINDQGERVLTAPQTVEVPIPDNGKDR